MESKYDEADADAWATAFFAAVSTRTSGLVRETTDTAEDMIELISDESLTFNLFVYFFKSILLFFRNTRFVSPIRFANAKRVAASASALLEVPAPYNKEEIIEMSKNDPRDACRSAEELEERE